MKNYQNKYSKKTFFSTEELRLLNFLASRKNINCLIWRSLVDGYDDYGRWCDKDFWQCNICNFKWQFDAVRGFEVSIEHGMMHLKESNLLIFL